MIERAFQTLLRSCTALGALAIAIMMLATCWDIAARTLANAPLHGVVELVEIMVLTSAMLGLPEVFFRDEQITVDLVDSVLPHGLLMFVKAVALVLTIVFLAILAVNVYVPMADAYEFGDVKYDLHLPLYPFFGLIIFCFAISILSCLAMLWRTVTGGEG
mgnify:CR=1 FL=1